jgi:septal ring factor EnvC (AmiA/AmiB activator)
VSIALVCTLAASLLLAALASGGGLDEARSRLAALEQQIAHERSAIEATHVQLDALGAKIADLQATHGETQVRLLSTERVLADVNLRYRERCRTG